MASSTRLVYRSPTGLILQEALPLSVVDYVRKENDIGVLSVRVVPKFPLGYFRRDGQIEVWRKTGGIEYLDTETAWFVRKIRYATTDQGEDEIELMAYDANVIVSDRNIAYDKGTSYTDKLGYADDLMKDIVRENYGTSVLDTARDLSARLAVQADRSEGAIVGDTVARKPVMDVLKNFSDASDELGVRILFDTVWTGPGQFEFRTYKDRRGEDHSIDSAKPVRVSRELGNLSGPEILVDYSEEINYVYAGGKGDEEWRLTAEASDAARIGASPFARREGWAEYSNEEDPVRLAKMANAELAKGRPRILFNGMLLDTPATSYGIHYRWGDLVTAIYKGYKFDCRIDAVHVRIDRDGGEKIESRLKGEAYV